MAAAHEQWRIYEVLVKAYNDLVDLKELAGEATEQYLMDKVYKAWARVVQRHGVTRTTIVNFTRDTVGAKRTFHMAVGKEKMLAMVKGALDPEDMDSAVRCLLLAAQRTLAEHKCMVYCPLH